MLASPGAQVLDGVPFDAMREGFNIGGADKADLHVLNHSGRQGSLTAEKRAAFVEEHVLRKAISKVLAGKDLNTLELGQPRAELETSMGVEAGSLGARRKDIKAMVGDVVKKRTTDDAATFEERGGWWAPAAPHQRLAGRGGCDPASGTSSGVS